MASTDANKFAVHVHVPRNEYYRTPGPTYDATTARSDLTWLDQIDQKTRERIIAVRVIENWWCLLRDKMLFRLLTNTVKAAEVSLPKDIIRSVCPRELDIAADKTIDAKIRFRFAGASFPPYVVFKIFLGSKGSCNVQYLTGSKNITTVDKGASFSLKQMGNRQFYEQMIFDACNYEAHKVTSEVDVATVKDYVKLRSFRDDLPSYYGGTGNQWRRLTLANVPKHTIMYDILDFVTSRVPSALLRREMPLMTSRAVTQEVQLRRIKALRRVKSPPPPSIVTAPHQQLSRDSGRRSKQAVQRSEQMRRTYIGQGDGAASSRELYWGAGRPVETAEQTAGVVGEQTTDDVIDEDEANKLYAWAQSLDYNDIAGYI